MIEGKFPLRMFFVHPCTYHCGIFSSAFYETDSTETSYNWNCPSSQTQQIFRTYLNLVTILKTLCVNIWLLIVKTFITEFLKCSIRERQPKTTFLMRRLHLWSLKENFHVLHGKSIAASFPLFSLHGGSIVFRYFDLRDSFQRNAIVYRMFPMLFGFNSSFNSSLINFFV